MENLRLWPFETPSPSGKKEDDFQAFMEFSLIEKVKRPRGAVIVLPGGGYSVRAPYEGIPVAERFRAHGFQGFTVEYHVAPYRYPQPQLDALRAIRIVRANAERWGVNPDQIAILGFSAGGHLASCAAALYDKLDCNVGDEYDNVSCRPDASIFCYTLHNVGPEYGHVGSGRKLLGEAYDDAAQRGAVDLERYIDKNTPPCFLWHTANDESVNRRNALSYAQKMWDLGNTAELHVFPKGSHGLGLAENNTARTWPELAATFLAEQCGFVNCD